MKPVDTQSLMLQMRSLAAQAASQPEKTSPVAKEGVAQAEDFSDLLTESVKAVNQQQHQAGDLKKAFEQGEEGVELSDVMLQVQKASLSFQAMTQVRNKLVEAYKDVMNMPV